MVGRRRGAATGDHGLDLKRLPSHVAIIMDGNGRWARRRGLPRVAGHAAARAAVRDVVRAASDLGLSDLTLYTFSSENWKRPKSEVAALMSLGLTRSNAERALERIVFERDPSTYPVEEIVRLALRAVPL